MIKILIADDHRMFREGLKHILAEYPDLVVADEANNGQEVLDKIWKNNYDMVLLDITMPGMTGLEALKQLKNDKPKLPVLILSMHPEEQYAVRVLRAGASGYLLKDSAYTELAESIRIVARGETYLPRKITTLLVREFLQSDCPVNSRQTQATWRIVSVNT